MDKQELYVAASRTRGETHLYATPEIQFDREEFAPGSPHLREGIPHIAEASERDRARLAAHEVALRSGLLRLPSEELADRYEEMWGAAADEARIANPRGRIEERIAEGREYLRENEIERGELLLNPEGGERLDRLETNARIASKQISRLEARLAELPAAGDSARRDLAVADRVLAERQQMAGVGSRLDPPTYITKELGERPSDPHKRELWDRGVTEIEGYRQRSGVSDPDKALGDKAKHGFERARQAAARQRLERIQRRLGRERQLSRSLERGMSLGIGR